MYCLLKGFFQPSKGNEHICPSCPVGQFTADPSQTTYIECDAGMYENNRIECLVCPKGFFQNLKARDSHAFHVRLDSIQMMVQVASEMILCKECDAGII